MKRLTSLMRRLAPVLGAGVIFQTTGCQPNSSDLLAEFTVAVLNNLIASYVFGAFGLAP